jgi:hypothetical protein
LQKVIQHLRGFPMNHLNRHPMPEREYQQVYLHPYPKELMLRNHR